MVRALVQEAKDLSYQIKGIGLGVCELVNLEGKLASDNCIEWLDLPVQEQLSVIAPTFIEADVRAAALAEACEDVSWTKSSLVPRRSNGT